MNNRIFNTQIQRLVEEYESKGFKMSKNRATEWYTHMENIPPETFVKMITHYIKNNPYIPTLADILSLRDKFTSIYKEE